MKRITLQMETLTCPTCAAKIKSAIQNTTGVAEAEVLFNSSKAKVSYDESLTSPEALKEVVVQLGFEVLSISDR